MIYPFLPLRDFILLPFQEANLFFGRRNSIKGIEYAVDKGSIIVVSCQKDPNINNPKIENIFTKSVTAKIKQVIKLIDGTYKVSIEGLKPFDITNLFDNDFYSVEGEVINETYDWGKDKVEIEALMRNVISNFQIYTKINGKINIEDVINIISKGDPYQLCYGIAAKVNFKISDKQSILEANQITEKLSHVYSALASEIDILEIEKKIKDQVKNNISKNQKEIYLNEQLNAIHNELGFKSDPKSDLIEFEKRLKALILPPEAKNRVEAELKKLKNMHPFSGETSIIRNYLEWIADIPWNQYTEEEENLTKVEEILNKDHYGLEKVKDRIIEYLAVRILSKSTNSPILCLVGPPGVGKTSLGKSIANSLNRKFVRISLGGVKDEAEIRGHRRTYLGALPGKIIQGMKRAGSSNPVFLLDEIDKLSSDYRGDPTSALLEVLDPEQNNTFNDHYLGMDYDLSKVLFISTANTLDSIPYPLRDRMEIIKIEGYTEYEKVEIAKNYLIPELQKNSGLINNIKVLLPDKTILEIIRNYTREAGVRNLKREIEKILRKIAKDFLKKNIQPEEDIHLDEENIEKYLGVKKFKYQTSDKISKVGVTNGLAWTQSGGDILSIEVSVMKGQGNLYITGKLGEIMQESAKTALSYVRTRSDILGFVDDFYKLLDFHIHVPEGATPKDGPSAGITIATSIISALTSFPVSGNYAMTGEITLRGDILPIGGLKEKLLAAKRFGIKNIIIPEENIKDLKEISDNIKETLIIKPVKHMDELFFEVFDISESLKETINNKLQNNLSQRKLARLIMKDYQKIPLVNN